ncbi:methyltetrahydrofolate:homocysteine methyltransferase related [Holotrichia oblita]|uniref:Methyltetrahydrofolate:homocysteine methyltransferase related n=1 Tax=Holotrichia oblita TaxID=644536 RepID=A0ACB9SJB1_HOLOL|nr:methyltetrahydrofolate:homocysteine methyltransferase related [Holotrichia oblita]
MTAINQEEFPILKNDRILKVIKGEKPDKLPIWVMRQAGRYMPKFREFRKLHTFFEICQTPELACEVTLMPIERFDLDAAIIFSDILVVPQALGLEVEMKESVIRYNREFKKFKFEGAANRLNYVGKAITLTRKKLNGKVPLIGFSGAPILFAKGSHYSLEKQKSLGYDVMGIDWTISPKTVRQILGDQVVQGNLDPCALYSSPDRIKDHVEEMIKGFEARNLVVNLGHGIYPDMSEEAVESFINAVHNVKL